MKYQVTLLLPHQYPKARAKMAGIVNNVYYKNVFVIFTVASSPAISSGPLTANDTVHKSVIIIIKDGMG